MELDSNDFLIVDVDNENPSGYENLFAIVSYQNKYARLSNAIPLKGFSGKWKLEIRAYDRGDEWDSRVSLSSKESYTVNIKPFNFNIPRIVFPSNDALIRLE